MNDLSPAARELVEAHRRDRTLTVADRKRIKQKLMMRVATLAASTAAAGTAAGMSLASKIALGAVGVTALIGVGALSVGVMRARGPSPVASTAAATPTAPMVAAPVVSPPVPAVTPERAGAPTTFDAAEGSRRESVKRLKKRPAISTAEPPTPVATSPAAPDPGPELRALREAREDLRAGRPESAYRRLDDFERQHGGGMLSQERSALSAIAYCQWRPGAEARARAAEFLRRSPESPLANRVSSACQKADEPSP